jgi:hypothetical protein
MIMNKSTSNGFESHPLHDLYFFELSFVFEVLNGKKVHLHYRHGGENYDGVFTMRAWPHPRLSGFLALKAQGDGWGDASHTVRTVYTVTFDSNRANKIHSATHKDYEFEADLGDLQPLQQVPHIWDAVRADFDREVAKIGPIRDVA